MKIENLCAMLVRTVKFIAAVENGIATGEKIDNKINCVEQPERWLRG